MSSSYSLRLSRLGSVPLGNMPHIVPALIQTLEVLARSELLPLQSTRGINCGVQDVASFRDDSDMFVTAID